MMLLGSPLLMSISLSPARPGIPKIRGRTEPRKSDATSSTWRSDSASATPSSAATWPDDTLASAPSSRMTRSLRRDETAITAARIVLAASAAAPSGAAAMAMTGGDPSLAPVRVGRTSARLTEEGSTASVTAPRRCSSWPESRIRSSNRSRAKATTRPISSPRMSPAAASTDRLNPDGLDGSRAEMSWPPEAL